jgi:hypothetical protein
MNMGDHVPPPPQFQVVSGQGRRNTGAKVFFNGQEIRNVVSVNVQNHAKLDDVWTSTITIQLRGESIPVLIPPEEQEQGHEER